MASGHDAHQCVSQLRQTLAADKLPIGFFLGAGCPCAVMVQNEASTGMSSIIPDVQGLTSYIDGILTANDEAKSPFAKLRALFKEDEVETPNVELMLNRVRQFPARPAFGACPPTSYPYLISTSASRSDPG